MGVERNFLQRLILMPKILVVNYTIGREGKKTRWKSFLKGFAFMWFFLFDATNTWYRLFKE